MIVSRVMTKTPVCIYPSMPLAEARSIMDREKIGHLPVLDKNNILTGIVAREDLFKAAPSSATALDVYELSYLLSKITVQEIMKKNVITVDENEVIEEAARIMADNSIGCLPVTRGVLLAGIITDTDLFRVFVNVFGARHPGVRLTVNMGEHPGQLAKISRAIAGNGGNIISFVTFEGDDADHRLTTFKVEGLTGTEMETIIKGFSDMVLEDIRK